MLKILLAEDDHSVRQNILDLLEAEDFSVKTAQNGKQAIQLLKEFLPDLIICDVMMPEMDGHELLENLSLNPQLAKIPFIFLTAKADPTDFRQGMNLGADDYLTKPFTRDQLLNAINGRIKKSENIGDAYEGEFNELRTNIAVSLPHELRTPLTGIMGFAEYLIDNIDTTKKDELLEYLTYIYESGKRLNRLVENYIAYSELQLKKHSPSMNLSPITKTLSVMEYLIQIAQTVSFEYERQDDLELNVDDVEIRIAEKDFEKICAEVIDNAFRYSRLGQKVVVEAQRKGDHLRVLVKDHGLGMNEGQIQRLGGFVQLNRDKHEQQGAGLGLTIARQLVELHGGTFRIESKEKYGTTIHFSLPCVCETK